MPRLLVVIAALLLLSVLPTASCNCDPVASEPLNEAPPVAQAPELVEFGPVAELTSATQPLTIENVGLADLEVNAVIGDGADFALDVASVLVQPGAVGELVVRFSPVGSGEDSGSVVLGTNDPDNDEITVALHGGPIEPALVCPVQVVYQGEDSILAQEVTLQNDGLAVLHIDSVAVDPGANPQFGFAEQPPFDVDVLPGEALLLVVEHYRSARADNGRLLVRTNDPDDVAVAGTRVITLLPDPYGPCEDGVDNDGDGLADFPDDPGCDSPADDTEDNGVACVNGATRACGTDQGICEPGTQTCANNTFDGAPCEGETPAEPLESCDGEDDNCDGTVDEGITEACDANGAVEGCEGFRVCTEDSVGVFGPCIPDESGPEECDGADNNCDGLIDNGVTQACTGPGGCAGTEICNPTTGEFGDCFCGVCGDGNVDQNEECDDNNTTEGDGCSDICVVEFCGDGDVDPLMAPPEECDDGGIAGGACDDNCQRECGNGVRNIATEQCDDGNEVNGDGCSSTCQNENPVCDVDGDFTLDSPFSYSCCIFVDYNVSTIRLQANGATAVILPSSSGSMGGSSQCPAGNLDYVLNLPGGCDELYELTGTFTGPDTFSGTFDMTFTGPDCDCFGGMFGSPCISQSFSFTATR